MAGTSNVSFTMQELGNPVSLAGQGEQAGPQTSSLCDCSSSQVGDLACVGYNATSSLIENHECNKDRNIFCYMCGQFEVQKYRRFITNVNREWAPQIMCDTCLQILNRWKKFKCDKSKRDKILKF